MTTHARKVWCVNAVNKIVLLSAFFNALCAQLPQSKEEKYNVR